MRWRIDARARMETRRGRGWINVNGGQRSTSLRAYVLRPWKTQAAEGEDETW